MRDSPGRLIRSLRRHGPLSGLVLGGMALVAATLPALAQTERPHAADLKVTDQGKVVAVSAAPAKIPDRAPTAVQMVFEAPASAPPIEVLCRTIPLLSPEAAEALVRRIAEAERFYPDFVVAVARAESRFDVAARSAAGAHGLMQLTPATAERFGVDLCDPEENVRGGIRFLRHLWERLRNPFYILAAYRAGEDTVARHKGVPPDPETVAFVAAVISDFYGYPPIGAATGPERPMGSAAPVAADRPRAVPAAMRRPSSATPSRPVRRSPQAQDWMVLHLE